MTPNYDLIADGIAYGFVAFVSYVLFSSSQNFRLLYIERMGHPTYRQITKCFEYISLLGFGYCLLGLSHYEGLFYYLCDVVLAGFIIRQFLRGDRLHRGQYISRYNENRRKSLLQMIIHFGHYSTYHNN
jgi:hypothetical protein